MDKHRIDTAEGMARWIRRTLLFYGTTRDYKELAKPTERISDPWAGTSFTIATSDGRTLRITVAEE